MNSTLDYQPAENTGSNVQIISALILSIFASLSSLILHYKLKHFKICCLESDCVNSPPPTPHIQRGVAPLNPHIHFNERPIEIKKEDHSTTESEQHKSQEN